MPSNEQHNPQVRVASYSNTTWQGAWRQRARAVWGTGLFGLGWGALMGGVIAAALWSAGVITTPMPAAILVAGLASTGCAAGLFIGDSVGTAAGAVGSGMAEWESRFKQMMLEAGLFTKEMVQKEPISAALNRSEVVDTPEEVNVKSHMFTSLVNWKSMAVFAVLGFAMGSGLGYFGLITMPGAVTSLIGTTATAWFPSLAGDVAVKLTTALFAGTLVAGAAAAFGVNGPVVSNHLNNMFSKVFSNEIFGEKQKPYVHAPVPKIEHAAGEQLSPRETMIMKQDALVKGKKPEHHVAEFAHQDRIIGAISKQIH
jgi:hypothetical protein